MDLTYIIIAIAILFLPAFLTRLGSSTDTTKVLGAEPRSQPAGVVVKRAVQAPGTAPVAQPRPALTRARARETSNEVTRLVKAGQKIEAIKLVRERTRMGLKEAIALVDRLDQARRLR